MTLANSMVVEGPMKSMLRIKPPKEPSLLRNFFKFLLSEGGLLLVIVAYALLGARLYMDVESNAERGRYESKLAFAVIIEDSISYVSSTIGKAALKENMTKGVFEAKVGRELIELNAIILKGINEHSYDGEVQGWDWDWNFSKSLLFTISIMTSIGYGHIAPKTFLGQMITLPYSLVGMGIFMVFLAKVGHALATLLKYIYTRVLCTYMTSRREETLFEISDEPLQETPPELPISLSIFVLSTYLTLGSWLFSTWESWSMMSSLYFNIITLTTIGFGDLTPSFDANSWSGKIKIVAILIYVVCGMALISMVISLLQEGAKKKADTMAKSLSANLPEDEPQNCIQ